MISFSLFLFFSCHYYCYFFFHFSLDEFVVAIHRHLAGFWSLVFAVVALLHRFCFPATFSWFHTF